MRANPQPAACPTCQQAGQPVDALTLKALLAVPLNQLEAKAYRLCRTPDCPTVYYSEDGAQCFGEADLRERVYQKHPADQDVFVCYCFRYTVGEVEAATRQGRASEIINAIQAGTRAGQCACEIRNPQGSCCLGNVRGLVKRLEAE